jgi:hypothetical protein
MRVLITGFLLLATTPALVAQAAPESAAAAPGPRAQGYAFFGFGDSLGDATSVMNLGAGGERRIHGGLAAGGDLSYLYTGGRFGHGLGLGTANLSYHFRALDRNGRWVPFVTGGVAVVFRNGAASLGNYGGGVTCWLHPRLGARLEVLNLRTSYVSSVLFRFGLSFR